MQRHGLLGGAALLAAAAGFAAGGTGAALAVLAGVGIGALARGGYGREVAAPQVAGPRDGGETRRGQLDAVLASVGDGVVVVDADGIVRLASTLAGELLACSFDPASPRLLAALAPWPQLEQALATCVATGAPQAFEGAHAGGRTLAVQITPWRRDGALAGAVIVLRDQSRLRQLESHRRDFVANVSHELKTPLAAIQGFVETLLDDPDVPPPTQRRFLQRVHKQVERLATLVADLLTLSRLDDHVAEPSDPCELGAVVREVARDLQPLAERRTVRLCCELPSASVWVRAEREALRQVVSNLVDNAIKYTSADGSVTVRLASLGNSIEVTVTDTGIGLSEADRERVFERFYRVDKARSRELGGTGLGLSIVKNTVQGLGGEVGVQSRLGHGSTFWVRLPTVAMPP